MTTVLPDRVSDHLRSVLFSTIWNEPSSRSRVNFELAPIATTSTVSSIDLGYTRLMLPVTGMPFRVYSVNRSQYQGWGVPPASTWMTSDKLAAQTFVDVLTYDYSGRIVDPTHVWTYYCPYNETVYVAIPNYIMRKNVTDIAAPVYQTIFRDTERSTVTQLLSVIVSNVTKDSATINAFISAIPTAQQKYVVYVKNGIYVLPENIASVTLAVGDNVVLSFDPDVFASVDVSVDNQTTGYYSTVYGEYRELLHTPKSINPNSLLLRASDVSMVIYDPVSGAARYLHRLTASFVRNVTHNDFSISHATIDAFRDVMGVSDVKVRVFYRNGKEPRTLTHDMGCINSLYLQSDDDIVSFLLGIKDVGVPEWKAANLEGSPYIALMNSVPSAFPADPIQTYSDALGWYRLANLLTQIKATYTYQDADVLIQKPSYLLSSDVDATVYANGLKVPDRFTSLTQQGQNISVGYNPGANVVAGSRIDVQMCQKASRTPITLEPTASNTTFTLPHADMVIYSENTPSVSPMGVCGSYATTYAIIPPSDANYTITTVGGTTTITFAQKMFGMVLYAVSQKGRTVQSIHVDDMLTAGDPIVFPIGLGTDLGTIIPIANIGRVSVYVNGRRLVNGIDYTNIPVYIQTTQLVESPIVVSNLTYFKPSGNIVEVVLDDFSVLFSDVGYVRTNVCWRQSKPWVWGDNEGNVFVRGALSPSVVDNQSYLLAQHTQQDGSPFYTEILLDRTVAGYMNEISPTSDYDIRSRVDTLAPKATPTIVDPLVISDAYVLYSPYLSQIIQDMVAGVLQVGLDDSDTLFLAQFSGYDLLKQRDTVIGLDNDNINRNLVDITVGYKNPTVTDLTMVHCIDRLTKLVFNNKTPTLENTLI